MWSILRGEGRGEGKGEGTPGCSTFEGRLRSLGSTWDGGVLADLLYTFATQAVMMFFFASRHQMSKWTRTGILKFMSPGVAERVLTTDEEISW